MPTKMFSSLAALLLCLLGMAGCSPIRPSSPPPLPTEVTALQSTRPAVLTIQPVEPPPFTPTALPQPTNTLPKPSATTTATIAPRPTSSPAPTKRPSVQPTAAPTPLKLGKQKHLILSQAPAYGQFGAMAGRVEGVEPAQYRIACLINHNGWWNKPTFADRVTAISSEGLWRCNVTLVSGDEQAVQLAAFLVPVAYSVPQVAEGAELPAQLIENAKDWLVFERTLPGGCSGPVVKAGANGRIWLSEVPPKGKGGVSLRGCVKDVNPENYRVGCFILVGNGWWTKPTFAAKSTPITSAGTWECAITTGGTDAQATRLAAFLVPKSFDLPTSSGSNLPQSLYANAADYVIYDRP